MSKKKRATCIVELDNEQGDLCILIAEQHGYTYDLLPGGRVEKGEAPIMAAVRELEEETGIKSQGVIKIFEHISRSPVHHVFYLIPELNADPKPKSDIRKLWWLEVNELVDLSIYTQLSKSTVQILEKYYLWREDHETLIELLHLGFA